MRIKNTPIIIIGLVLVLLISPVQGAVTNPGFETGDYSGWTAEGSCTTRSTATDYVNTGDYSHYLHMQVFADVWCGLTQTFFLPDFYTTPILRTYLKSDLAAYGQGADCRIVINGATEYTRIGTDRSFSDGPIDVSLDTYEGQTITLGLRAVGCSVQYCGFVAKCWFDDIQAVPITVNLTLLDSSSTPISGVKLKVNNTNNNYESTTDADGKVSFEVSLLDDYEIWNLDVTTPQSGTLRIETSSAQTSSDQTIPVYISGTRKIVDLGRFRINLLDFGGSAVAGGTLTVKNQAGSSICTDLTDSSGNAICLAASASYPSAGKDTLYYDLSVDTNGAYEDDPVFFNDYVPRDDIIYVGGVHKYLPKHTSLITVEKTPIEIRYFPSELSSDFIFNDTIPSGFTFSGDVSITKHTSSGSESCSYTPSGTKFSISSSQCSMLSANIETKEWLELAYNTTAPVVPASSTQSYTIPAGTISYLS